VRSLWQALGAEVVIMDAETHDRILALVSHLPHMVAYGLVDALLQAEDQDGRMLHFSAGGFRDFTRIAASDPVMWRDICLANREHLLSAFAAFRRSFERLEELILQGDGEGLEGFFAECRRVKNRL